MVKGFLPPGFRFHPTDVELVQYYLRRKVMGKPLHFEAIAVVDMYKFAPWDLPAESILKSRDLEWYFFCPRDRKYANGPRTNRATEIGFWKTTGKDRAICYNMRVVGMKKTLVFHTGRAPKGARTDWVMHEFRLEDKEVANAGFFLDAYVLCRIFEKSGPGPKNGEQYGAPFNEEEWDEDDDDVHDAQAPAPLLLPTSVNSCSPSLFPNLPNHFEVGSSSSAPPIGGNIDKTRENDTQPTSISDGDLSAFPEGYDLEKILMELNDSIDIPSVSLNAAIAENSSGCHGNILSEKSCTSQDGSEIFDGLGDITAHEELNRLYSLDSSFDENMLENPDMYGFLEVSDFVLPDLSKDGMHTMLPPPDGMATAAVADSEVNQCKEFSGFEANQGLTSSISLQEVENYENELQSLLDQELPFR